MQVTSLTRVDAIFRALLVDDHTPQRVELAESGVSQRRIGILYPYEISTVTNGVHAYVAAGKRILLNQTSEVQAPIADMSLDLYRLLTSEQVSAASSNFGNWWQPISGAVNAIIDHPGTVFKEYGPDTAPSLMTPRSDASDLVTRLLWGVTHVMELGIPAADEYLEVVVDTCMPDLLDR